MRYFGYFILGIRGPKDRSEQIIKRSIHGPFNYLRYRMMLLREAKNLCFR